MCAWSAVIVTAVSANVNTNISRLRCDVMTVANLLMSTASEIIFETGQYLVKSMVSQYLFALGCSSVHVQFCVCIAFVMSQLLGS